MRRVFVIGDVPAWTTGQAIELAVQNYLESRQDLTAPFRVFVTGKRLNVAQIPDAVADDLRRWYVERLRTGRLTSP